MANLHMQWSTASFPARENIRPSFAIKGLPSTDATAVPSTASMTVLASPPPPTINSNSNSRMYNNNHNTLFGQPSLKPSTLVIRERDEEIIAVVAQRLERAAERIRLVEMEKLKAKLRGGGLSHVENVEVERMGRELIRELVEAPVRYLRIGTRGLDERVRDVTFLARALEESLL